MPQCEEADCKSEATYGFKFAQPVYCRPHGLLHKAVTQQQVCRCGASVPRFKLPSDERASCCAKCKTEKMINVADRRCSCGKHLPTQGMPTDKRPDYCSECKKEGMINLKDKNKKCECGKVIPSFGFPEDKKSTCCVLCKKEGMISLLNDLCPCGKSAAFGFPNDKKPSYCKTCSKEGMENIVTKKCSCGKAVPTFGLPTDKKAKQCAACKTDKMVNISAKMCSCGKAQPTFGLSSDTVPTCCASCRSSEMIDIRSKKCVCGKAQPVFGNKDDKKATCCAECRTESMINVKARMCECGKSQPFYGKPGETKAYHCGSCKKEGMIDIITINCPTKTCKGTFELQAQGLKCPQAQRGKKKQDYQCTKCFEQNFPQDERSNQIRSKSSELIVRDFLAQNFTTQSFIHNKPLQTGQADCTCRRRIDFRTLQGNTLLCVEVDEDQHKYRNKEDETLRYDDLMMLHGGKFIFVRFNPDSQIDKQKKKRNPPLQSRLATLKHEIIQQMIRIYIGDNTELLEVKYLYFDGYETK